VSTDVPGAPEDFGRDLSGEALEELAVNTIRALAMDGVEKANSGHPGMPMGAADYAFVLWTKFLRHSPADPRWPDRDRFLLSAGHGSMLLYALLHLFGYPVPMEQLKLFRQWGSITPGHPEYLPEVGLETTTGPLGQGFGNGVGMAIAERALAARFNSPGEVVVDHCTYAIVSDGDLMEGVASEAASLAGHLGLGRLIYLYDDNRITIEGSTDLAFSEEVGKRFQAYRWHVQEIDGHDRKAAEQAIAAAKAEAERPSLIVCRTHIARGSPNKQDTAAAHGEPLGEEEVIASKRSLGFPVEPAFLVPRVVGELFARRRAELEAEAASWRERFAAWSRAHPELAAEWNRRMKRELPPGLSGKLVSFPAGGKGMATRSASGEVIQKLAAELPELIGGSADLAPSTKTLIKGSEDFERGSYQGRNLRFGVREHAMGAALNGLSLHGGLIPYGGTFLIFSDYMRPSIRLAAMMKQPVIYVFTHDSIFLGEDGPTHQPIEHLPSLRAIPNLTVIRPADANEVAVAWLLALENREGPTALLLTRQDLPVLDRARLAPAERLRRGGYVLARAEIERPDLLLLASGSEVHVALAASELLARQGKCARVINLACWSLFDRQPEQYRREVLPPGIKRRLAVEAASPLGWEKYVGDQGKVIGMTRFGASAPYKVLAEKFGYTPEAVAREALALLNRQSGSC
jgi:transketolase